MRAKAIWNAFKHGIMPWWCYEKQKHYKGSYWAHLWLNMKYGWRWLTFREYESDIEFEKKMEKKYTLADLKAAHYAGWYNGLVNAYRHDFSWKEYSELLTQTPNPSKEDVGGNNK